MKFLSLINNCTDVMENSGLVLMKYTLKYLDVKVP